MLSNKTIFLALSAFIVGAVATPVPAPSSGCADVHIITARASTESPGEGIIGDVVSGVVSRSKQTVSREAVDYPALLVPYESSEAAGVAAMKVLLARKTSACPNTKIVLMGYSQGAHVSGDVLQAGATGTNKVAAVVLMGDPAHVRGESFQKGTATLLNGLFARRSGALNAFASKIASYCDIGDLFCASGTSTIIHLGYVTKYGTAAVSFVLNQIGG
ncbi:cutinase [Collybia nuda]|uniref:Cutinase n=1 Tax=Collybia nuda TaxID=64659 RepID=A0A9P5YCD3_9AGAR|nr:cutinase [Collybia nuda]